MKNLQKMIGLSTMAIGAMVPTAQAKTYDLPEIGQDMVYKIVEETSKQVDTSYVFSLNDGEKSITLVDAETDGDLDAIIHSAPKKGELDVYDPFSDKGMGYLLETEKALKSGELYQEGIDFSDVKTAKDFEKLSVPLTPELKAELKPYFTK